MRRRLYPMFLLLIPFLAGSADLPLDKPHPVWSRQFSWGAQTAKFQAAAVAQDESIWLAGRKLWKLDGNGELQKLANEEVQQLRERTVNLSGGRRVTESQRVNPALDISHPFRTGEKQQAVFAVVCLADGHPLIIFQMEGGRVVSGLVESSGRISPLEEIAGAAEGVVIHAAVTADDQAVYLLGERLGVAFLARLDEHGKQEWKRLLPREKTGATDRSRLLDGVSAAHGGVEVIGDLFQAGAAPRVRVMQIGKSGDAGRELSFPGRALALAGGLGRDGVALYESAEPGKALTLLSLDENLGENWRAPLPVPGRAAGDAIRLKAAAGNGTLAAAVVDGRLWAVRIDRRGQTVWDFRPDYRAVSTAIVTAQPTRFFLFTSLEASGGDAMSSPVLIVDKFAEPE